MFENHDKSLFNAEEFAALGTDAVAYMKKMTASEIQATFPDSVVPDENGKYWALFAADGQPLMLADEPGEVVSNAFYNDLHAILPS